ncbi:MAG: cation diffusion facilitator family transporter [Gammaproteobacteria bacterium]|nr:MAG: cation diffusion facilitator family transporter [Gammaproteobacteria bacterium]
MSSSSRKVIYAALAGNGLIAITKFIAASITGSSAMLSEAIHSVVDTGNQLLLLYGLKRSKTPPSEQFPFGHGKEVYFWSFIVAILIFAVGAGVSIYEGVHSILQPAEIQNVMVNYIVIGIAIVFEGAAWYFALHEFSRAKGKWGYIEAVQRGKDPSMFVVLFEDSAALLGLTVAFLGIWLTQVTGILYFDGVASILIGMILGGTAIWLAHETKGLLIGESAEPEVVESIRKLVSLYPDIENINEILTMHMGPDYILVNISIDFIDTTLAGNIEHIVAEMDKTIKQEHPRVKRIFIEAESRHSRSDPTGTDNSR